MNYKFFWDWIIDVKMWAKDDGIRRGSCGDPHPLHNCIFRIYVKSQNYNTFYRRQQTILCQQIQVK